MSFASYLKSFFVDAKPQARPPDDADFWYEAQPYPNPSGVAITDMTALRCSVVMACVKVLSESIGWIPLHLMRREGNTSNKDVNNPLYNLIAYQPNHWQTSFEWREMCVGHLCLRGNAYNLKIPGPSGAVDQLIPKHPDKMKPKVLPNGQIIYEYRNDKGQTELYRYDEVMHWRLFSTDGIVGLNPIEYASTAIGLSVAAEEYGAKFFRNSATPGGVIKHPGVLGPQGIENFRRSWNEIHRDPHKVAILEEGMSFQELGLKNTDAQFLQSRQFQLEDIARVFRVPAHMVGNLLRATYSNVEQQSLDFVIHCLTPWVTRIEQAMKRDLLYDPANYIKFNLMALLRGDNETRANVHNIYVRMGAKSVNEVREDEDMNPIGPDGDKYERDGGATPVPTSDPKPPTNSGSAVSGAGVGTDGSEV